LKLDIEKALPHRGRMKLLNRIVDVHGQTAVTQASVTPLWPVVENDAVDSVVIIELVAQTSAVCVWWKNFQDNGKKEGGVRGWLVGVKQASFFVEKIPVGAVITTMASIVFTMDDFTEIRGESESDGKILGKVVLQVIKENAGENN
jgi:predicted hotdog family 3-hydroxylacyl-ACP dehydratase